MSAYKLQFDTANFSPFQNLPLYILIAGIFVLGLVIFRNAKRIAPFFTRTPQVIWPRAFGVFLMVVSVLSITGGVISAAHLRDLRAKGALQVTEGCLTEFHPEGWRRGDSERITVGGVRFSYASNDAMAHFHTTEAAGGPIHPDTRVRLGYVGDDILRVETIDHACPRAPD